MEMSERRISPLPSLDEQSLRSTLDRALQLISQDLADLCRDAIADDPEERWTVAGHEGRPFDVMDPVFWTRHFSRSTSPIHQVVGRPAGQLSRDFDKVRRLRNRLYHFGVSHDPASTKAALFELLRVARACGLRAADDIECVHAEIAAADSGESVGRPTLLAVMRALEGEQQAAAAAEQQDWEHEWLADELGRTRDALEQAQEARDIDAQRISQLEDEAHRLTRLLQESEIRANHLQQVHEAALAAMPVERPELPRGMDEFLRTLLSVIGVLERLLVMLPIAADEWRPNLARQRNQVEAFLPGTVMQAPGQPSAPATWENLRDAWADLRDARESAFKGLRDDMEHIRTEMERLGLGEDDEVPEDLLHTIDVVDDSVRLIEECGSTLSELTEFVRSALPPDGPQELVDAVLPLPGQRWTWPRGEEVWVLSAAHGRIKRGSEAVGFVERYGPRLERRLVDNWLAIRPEGGRVYIDVDGDACTLGAEGEYIYLGRVERFIAI